MARDIFGNRKITKEDLYTRKRSINNADIRWEKLKMVVWILLGGLYAYLLIQPQNW